MTTPLNSYTIPNTIRPRMSSKEYWARSKQLRAAYKQQQNELNQQFGKG